MEEVVQKTAVPAAWNTEETSSTQRARKPKKLNELSAVERPRLSTKDAELDRVLGGGLVAGSMILLGGEPGIGKSTLLLQVALSIPESKILYVSGEESEEQVHLRAQRVGIENEDCYLLAETNTQNIFAQIKLLKPDVLVIDSIQTLYSNLMEAAPGSVGQIRQCTAELLRFAKESGTPVLLIGHITKDGQLAGPKLMEHMVDVVLQFEGDRNHTYRLLRAAKNRFGSTAEIGIYEMLGAGLRQVLNPSELLISPKSENLSGVSIAAALEGQRPMLVEIQALVSSAVYGNPQRSVTGFDLRRLNMLLAVLEKRCGFQLASKDVFLNITGGIKVDDPAIDLAVAAAILSSAEDIPIPTNFCFAAEVGLTGEIRAISRVEERIREAEKLGFDEIFVSAYNKLPKEAYAIKVQQVKRMDDLFAALFA